MNTESFPDTSPPMQGKISPVSQGPIFSWHTFDLRSVLPKGWVDEIIAVANIRSVVRNLTPTSITSRELDRALHIRTETVDGLAVKEALPWLWQLYANHFLRLARVCAKEDVLVCTDELHAMNVMIQRGTDARYECHVDTNPVQGILYVTDHPPGSGGELVVATRPNDLCGPELLNRNVARIYPVAGYLVFFDATKHAHYVTALAEQDSIRVVVAMNYYTSSVPESTRPADLTEHLYRNSEGGVY
ncbi:MAG: 2OG-Fe(II) oxygenase [Acidobacteria bacterium]|nr:2OG-Fe(II) oxygenase [Acidobacteriota bacterium]